MQVAKILARSDAVQHVHVWLDPSQRVDVAGAVQNTASAICSGNQSVVSADAEKAMRAAAVAALADKGSKPSRGQMSAAASWLDEHPTYLAALAVTAVALRVVCAGAVSEAICERPSVTACRKATNGPSRIRCYAEEWLCTYCNVFLTIVLLTIGLFLTLISTSIPTPVPALDFLAPGIERAIKENGLSLHALVYATTRLASVDDFLCVKRVCYFGTPTDIYTHTRTHTHTPAHTHTHARTHARTHTHAHKHTRTHAHAHMRGHRLRSSRTAMCGRACVFTAVCVWTGAFATTFHDILDLVLSLCGNKTVHCENPLHFFRSAFNLSKLVFHDLYTEVCFQNISLVCRNTNPRSSECLEFPAR